MPLPDILILAVLVVGAYLAGSVPSGLLLIRRFASIDLRTFGSGNIGATNAKRAGGWPLGLATLFLDILKGALPTGLAVLLFGRTGIPAQAGICLVAIGAFAGHLHPVYLGFKTGGKGVATAAGCFIILSHYAFLAALGMFIAATATTQRVSAGSLAAAAILPPAVYVLEGPVLATGALVISILILVRHRENIRRLLSGTEPKLTDKHR